MENNPTNIIVTERDMKVLTFVKDQRAVSFDVIHKRLFAGAHKDMVKSVLRRLCGHPPRYRLLRPIPIIGGRKIYQLTYGGTSLLGCSRSFSRPVGPQGLVKQFAFQWFLFLDSSTNRQLVDGDALRQIASSGDQALPALTCYIDGAEDHPVLGVLIIDYGGSAPRIVFKSIARLRLILERGWFDAYVQSRSFEMTILTISEGKKRSIEAKLRRHFAEGLRTQLVRLNAVVGPGKNIDVKVLVVPGLDSLVFSEKETS